MAAVSEFASAVGSVARRTAWGAGALAAAGGVAAGYGLLERNRFQVRHESVAVLPPGIPDIRVLHLSDIHMVPGQELKRRWLHSLADLEPDLVVNTGDNLSHRSAVGPLLEALGPLMRFPGVYVPGSNCYFAPRLKNPLRYLRGPSGTPRNNPNFELPWREMHAGFGSAGWLNLANRNLSMPWGPLRIDFSGVDDPHLGRDAYTGWPRGSSTSSLAPHVRIALAHAPYQRVLDYPAGGADVIFAPGTPTAAGNNGPNRLRYSRRQDGTRNIPRSWPMMETSFTRSGSHVRAAYGNRIPGVLSGIPAAWQMLSKNPNQVGPHVRSFHSYPHTLLPLSSRDRPAPRNRRSRPECVH